LRARWALCRCVDPLRALVSRLPCLSPRSWLAANMYKGFTFHFSRSREEATKST
jgi:hypothetical protein